MNVPIKNFYDAANARTLCKLSGEAYSPVLQPDTGWVGQRIIPHPCLGLLAVITWSQADIVVAFRGTVQCLIDFVLDADCLLVPCEFNDVLPRPLYFHAGFYKAYQDLRGDILKELRQHLTKRLWITGHSLGGAIAAIHAADVIVNSSRPVPNVYTFGQPRTGDYSFAKWISSRLDGYYFRAVHSADAVPQMPHLLLDADNVFGSKFAWHGGREAFYTEDGLLEMDPPYYKKARNDVADVLRQLMRRKFAVLDDHAIATYAEAIN